MVAAADFQSQVDRIGEPLQGAQTKEWGSSGSSRWLARGNVEVCCSVPLAGCPKIPGAVSSWGSHKIEFVCFVCLASEGVVVGG